MLGHIFQQPSKNKYDSLSPGCQFAVIYLFSVLLHPISLSKKWHERHTEILIGLLSHCQPYSFVLIGYYCGRFMRILKSWYVSGVLYWHWRWEAVAGVIAGFCTSIMTVILFALLRKLFSCIYQLSVVRRFTLPFNKVRLRRVCFLLAYVSFTSWLAVQYFRRIGLPEIAVYYSMQHSFLQKCQSVLAVKVEI